MCAVAVVVAVAAARVPTTHRKLLTLSSQQTSQGGPLNRPAGGIKTPVNTANAQLAANNAAIVNTQLAIEAAVDSGADPYVTEAATNYGADQAYWASQVNKHCGWYKGKYYRC